MNVLHSNYVAKDLNDFCKDYCTLTTMLHSINTKVNMATNRAIESICVNTLLLKLTID